ncbi:MAG: ComF family protein [Patescibacteria group bacterium]|nr:ComF family protein [Patescibacteria group bacterium]
MFKRLNNFIIDWLFPEECVICGASGRWLCNDCLENIEFSPINSCPFCHKFSFLGLTCEKCKKEKCLDGIFCHSSYKNLIVKKIIHHYKYNYLLDLKFILADMIANVLSNIKKGQEIGAISKILTEKTLFFPVPLHKMRIRYRGFNQSELLLEELAKQKIILPQAISLKLQRICYTTPQVKLKAKERIKNLKKAFAYKGKSLKNRNIILIDDVATTCSTLNECAQILKQHGARKVYGIVIAKG